MKRFKFTVIEKLKKSNRQINYGGNQGVNRIL